MSDKLCRSRTHTHAHSDRNKEKTTHTNEERNGRTFHVWFSYAEGDTPGLRIEPETTTLREGAKLSFRRAGMIYIIIFFKGAASIIFRSCKESFDTKIENRDIENDGKRAPPLLKKRRLTLLNHQEARPWVGHFCRYTVCPLSDETGQKRNTKRIEML